MKNIILAVIAIVVIIIAVLVTVPLIPDDYIDPVDPNNPDMDASFRQSVHILYLNGDTEIIDSGIGTLYLMRDNLKIDTINHKLECKLDGGAETISLRGFDIASQIKTMQGGILLKISESASSFSTTAVNKGSGWTELISINIDKTVFIYGLPTGDYSARLVFKPQSGLNGYIEYEFENEWKPALFPNEIEFDFKYEII